MSRALAEECEAAALDSKRVASIARRLESAAKDAALAIPTPGDPTWTEEREQSLVDALRRLSSTEAFTSPRAIDLVRDAELLARIDFARAEISRIGVEP